MLQNSGFSLDVNVKQVYTDRAYLLNPKYISLYIRRILCHPCVEVTSDQAAIKYKMCDES